MPSGAELPPHIELRSANDRVSSDRRLADPGCCGRPSPRLALQHPLAHPERYHRCGERNRGGSAGWGTAQADQRNAAVAADLDVNAFWTTGLPTPVDDRRGIGPLCRLFLMREKLMALVKASRIAGAAKPAPRPEKGAPAPGPRGCHPRQTAAALGGAARAGVGTDGGGHRRAGQRAFGGGRGGGRAASCDGTDRRRRGRGGRRIARAVGGDGEHRRQSRHGPRPVGELASADRGGAGDPRRRGDADHRLGARHRAQCRSPADRAGADLGARASRPGHRRDHPNGQRDFRSDEFAGAERRDRGGARRRARPGVRGGRRRGAGAGRELGKKRAGGRRSRRGDPGEGRRSGRRRPGLPPRPRWRKPGPGLRWSTASMPCAGT